MVQRVRSDGMMHAECNRRFFGGDLRHCNGRCLPSRCRANRRRRRAHGGNLSAQLASPTLRSDTPLGFDLFAPAKASRASVRHTDAA